MQYNNARKLEVIDGHDFGGFIKMMPIYEYEYFINQHKYSGVPKDDVISITKQDLIGHPEKFRPYTYSSSSDFSISYEDLAKNGLKYRHYSDGRSIIICDINNHISFEKQDLISDIVYMKIHYPNLYDELLKKSDLPDIFDEVEKQYTKESLNADNQPADPNSKDTGNDAGNVNGTGGSTKSIITPNEVNEDEMPEEITYIKKKMKSGVVYVPKTEEPVKAKDNKPEKNPQKEFARSITTEHNAMQNAIRQIRQDSANKENAQAAARIYNAMQSAFDQTQQQKPATQEQKPSNPPANPIPVGGGAGMTHVVNKPMPNINFEDIDLNDVYTRVDMRDTAGVIMKPDGTRYVVVNNPVPTSQPQVPVQQQPAPVQQQAPAVQQVAGVFDPAADPELRSVIEKLKGSGTFNVKLNTESGITRVLVEDEDGNLIDNLCFTVDLGGVCHTPIRKMWFGLPEIPDFAPSFAFNDAAINMIFTGEGEENLSPIFNAETCKLNRVVDLHSIFNIEGLTNADILSMMRVINGIVNKRSVKIELSKKENINLRFSIGSFKDPKNFRLILQNRTYLYNGGPLSNNKNRTFYIGIENNQMKFYAGKKSKKDQQVPVSAEQEEINKRITRIINDQLSKKPSDIVNASDDDNIITEPIEDEPVAATA